MENILIVSQIIISVLLSTLILMQNKDEGFSASGNQSFKAVRRGPEKVIFNSTVVLAALFLINAALFVMV